MALTDTRAEDIAEARCAALAVAMGDVLRDCSTGARYRILATLPASALVQLERATRLELGIGSEICTWCADRHPTGDCPELPLDLALVLAES